MSTQAAQRANTWVGRLITGLFTAAAAWGSVSMQISKTVDARADLTEQRLTQQLQDKLGSAMHSMDERNQTRADSLSGALQSIAVAAVKSERVRIVTPTPVVDTITPARLDLTNERLRNVAIAMAQLRNEIAELAIRTNAPRTPAPKHQSANPYGQ